MLPPKFRIIWPSGYRREEFLKSANQKQELPVVAMFVNGSGQIVPTQFQFIWQRGFRGIFICNSIHRDNCILNTDIYILTSPF